MGETENLDAEERWRVHPEQTEIGIVHAFGLYFLLRFPDDEAFDGYLSVGVSGPSPEDEHGWHIPNVVLGYTGDSGARLTNVLLHPDERELAAQLSSAADEVERYRALNDPTPEEKQEMMAELARAVLPRLPVETIAAQTGLSESGVRERLAELDSEN